MPVVFAFLLDCHPRESGGPGQATLQLPWIPAFAGMTFEKVYRTRLPNLAPMTLTLTLSRFAGEGTRWVQLGRSSPSYREAGGLG